VRGQIDTGLTVNALEALYAVRRRLRLCLGLALVAGLATVLLLRGLPPVYTATTLLWFDEREGRLLSSDSIFAALKDQPRVSWVNEVAPIVRQAAVLGSTPVLRRVAADLDLAAHPEALTTRRSRVTDTVRARLLTALPDALRARLTGDGATARPMPVVARLQEMVSVEVDELTSMMTISVASSDAALAARIANALPGAYLAEQNARIAEASGSVAEWLDRQAGTLRDRVEAGRVVTPDRLEMQQITQDADVDLYRDTLQRISRLKQLRTLEPQPIRVVAPAGQPLSPSAAGQGLYAAAVAGVVFLLSAGLAVLAEFASGRIRLPGQLAALGLTVLAVVPLMSRATVGGGDRFTEAIRRLLSATLPAAQGEGVVLAFTSATKGEGKSTIARELANAGARAGIATVLVEADLRTPGQPRGIGAGRHGLAGVLEGAPLDLALVDLPVRDGTRLSVLPTLRAASQPTELLASARMRSVMTELRARFDLIVIDTAPIGMTADASVIGQLADGVALVVEHGRVGQDRLRYCTQVLDRDCGKLIGCVVNRAPDAFLRMIYGRGALDYLAPPAPPRDPQWKNEASLARFVSARPTGSINAEALQRVRDLSDAG